jgi:hypothetical protein
MRHCGIKTGREEEDDTVPTAPDRFCLVLCVMILRPILFFANTDIFRHILVLNTYVFEKGNMDRREYCI